MKNYLTFLNEKKVFVYKTTFRIKSLLSSDFYSKEDINTWMEKYDFDEFARAILICDNKIKNIITIDIETSSKNKKNTFFDTSAKANIGFIIEESKILIGDDIVMLYVFDKNKNKDRGKTTRQAHGFEYESRIKDILVLNRENYNPSYTNKWDAYAKISEKLFLEDRDFKYGVSNNYIEVDWDTIDPIYKEDYYWSIKSIKTGSAIDIADFLRISGYQKKIENGKIKIIPAKFEPTHFMFNVSFHTNKTITTEYFILIPNEIWQTYLPDMEANLPLIEDMYNELGKHRFSGERDLNNSTYLENEESWKLYCEKYKKITENSDIKLRFKRDSKGQLRIQSSIPYLSFMNEIIGKVPHLKVT